MRVERLRLAGFKSFADPAEVVIGPGLTGVVGPNGCGKSNLADALRWVMGETSGRQLRSGAMEDVIFAGAAGRPARDIAEVTLTFDNAARDAPAAFNDRDEIEIIRRIERGGGSVWRVNGHEVRGRDARLLFADAATGGPSGAIVGQGRVGALIEAKPDERRFLLEEAAGVTGLRTRRHETETRLAAAADNLARLDDVITPLATRLAGLQRQARQAQRYRRLGEEIRRHEALLLHSRWTTAAAGAADRAAELAAAAAELAAAETRAENDARARAAADLALPELRRDEASAADELRRLTRHREALEEELARVVGAGKTARQRRDELVSDRAREDAAVAAAAAALTRLTTERASLAAAAAAQETACGAAIVRRDAATRRLRSADAELQRLAETAAAAAARHAALDRQRREADGRVARLEVLIRGAEQERAKLAGSAVGNVAVAAAAVADLADAEALVEARRAALDEARDRFAAARQHETAAQEIAGRQIARLARLAAEAEALDALLASAAGGSGGGHSSKTGKPVLSQLRVRAGFEEAVGALFADELLAPIGGEGESAGDKTDTASFWADLGRIGDDRPALPEGAHPLCETVDAPAILGRSLAQAGWVDSVARGRALQPQLLPGQRLVDRDGRLWRWDGFTHYGAGRSAGTRHLEQQNRRAALAADLAAASPPARSAETAAAAAAAARGEAGETERRARAALGEAEAALARTRRTEAEVTRRALGDEARLAALAERTTRIAADLASARAEAEASEHALAGQQAALSAAALDTARATAVELRREEAEARAAVERLTQTARSRSERLSSIDGEERSWRERAAGARRQQQILAERQRTLDHESAALALRQTAIAAEAETHGNKISAAARCRERAAERFAQGENRLRQAGESARTAERLLAEARERHARLEVRRDAACAARDAVRRDIAERLDTVPEELAGLAGLAGVAAGQMPPAERAVEERLARLVRERDGLGPVNLMAAGEAEDSAAQIAALQDQRADLTEAITRLRRGAAALDAEGRERLSAAFERVNRHFAELFARLFGGGKAALAWTEDGDPLAAGVEIMASPAGKRLRSLSLLSGGEQALAALALLFAVFLTRPAPVCVLDEVDAPLDDANVTRLCRLVAEIAASTGTRFLLITHHRITMARADRLFGVTMAEPGVSQLVSVDLTQAARLRRIA